MSDVVKFAFYYGPGTVQTTEMGDDLSEFDHIEVPMSTPQTWSVCQLKEWTAASLGLDTGRHTRRCSRIVDTVKFNNLLLFEANRARLRLGVVVTRL